MFPMLAEIDWNSLLQQPDLLAPVAVLTVTAVVVLGIVIAIQWRKVKQAKAATRLKEQMIERGFTADEIIGVINAGVSHDRAGKTAGMVKEVDARGCCVGAG